MYEYASVKNSDEYVAIEYLESTGTQWIDTGYKHNQNTRIIGDIDFQPVGSWKSPFGSWGGSRSSKKMFGGEYDGNTTFTLYYGNGSTSSINDKSVYTGRHIWDWNKNVWSIGSTVKTFTQQTFQSEFNFFVFGTSGYTGTTSSGTNLKVYSFKIYDNDILVRSFIPAIRKSDSVAGLYDTVNDVFYTNQGTGTFVTGPVITN